MTNKQLLARLRRGGACLDAMQWIGTRDLQAAWQECPRGDWLLWLCAKQIGQDGWPSHQDVVLAACACAETALVHVKAGEERPKRAIETARAWARGEATREDARAAAAAADADADAYAYAAAAAYAAARSRSLAESADLVRSMLRIPAAMTR